MKKCKSCQSEIDSKANKCPKCQSDQRNWFRRHPIITTILVLMLIGAIVSSGSDSKTATSTTPTSSDNSELVNNSTPSPVPVVEIEATQIISDFDTNKLNANEKYTGKIVQTAGYITNISNDIVGNYYLSLKPNEDKAYFGTTIACYFKSKEELTALAKGEKVTVRGTMQEMSLGIVSMKNCAVIK